MRGAEYDAFIDEFVAGGAGALSRNAASSGRTSPTSTPCRSWRATATRSAPINDDIQGTAAVALAGIYGALRISGRKLADQRFLFLGGGSAATGIAELISQAMALEGVPLDEARARNALFDINGLMVTSRNDLADFQKPFALDHAPVDTFVDAVEGASGPPASSASARCRNCSTSRSSRRWREINERPIIFPYSNPTSRSECTAEEAYRWSEGRAIFASGSPVPAGRDRRQDVRAGPGQQRLYLPGHGHGGASRREAKRVTEEMFIVAAKAVAEQVTEANLATGLIYPPQSHILTPRCTRPRG